jgi:hypothetical protein
MTDPPMYIILDVAWGKIIKQSYPELFDKLPVNDIIQKLMASSSLVNVHRLLMFNLEELFWSDIDERFSTEEANRLSVIELNKLFERILAHLYYQLKIYVNVPGETEYDYVFYKWLDENSLMLKLFNEDIVIDDSLVFKRFN